MTFPRILREEADDSTGYIGKWHMGFDDTRRPGFDHWVSFRGQGQFIDPVANVNGRRVQTDGCLTDLITQWGLEFLDRDFDRPFCLKLSHEAVHRPFIPAKRHEDPYRDVAVEAPVNDPAALPGKRALTRLLPESSGPHC
ncbi:MAG: sulfatase-like hydrolase/transferase [Planctomycetaceae bacterium]|jgi:N-acetylglucosamine-6-sulfatase